MLDTLKYPAGPYTGMKMLTAALTVTAFVYLARGVYGVHTESSSLDPQLETDCSGPKAENRVEVIPDFWYQFRTDYLTLDECDAYKEIQCSPTEFSRCRKIGFLNPFLRTYFELDCTRSFWVKTGTWRSLLRNFTNNFSIISPKRALAMKIREGNDTQDPLRADVFEPVRDQVIDLTVHAAASTVVTSKIYNIGLLPSLVALCIEKGWNLTIKRHHFNRIPSVRLIVFDRTTIMEIQPYTFTDLPHLQSLSVDKGLWHIFFEIDSYKETQASWYEERRLTGSNQSMPERPDGLWTDADVDKYHRIHCDCSFAWFRNFLKSKPELTAFKQPGAMAVIGSYESIFFDTFHHNPHVASVDCAKNLTKDNYQAGDQFSYNTTCFGSCA